MIFKKNKTVFLLFITTFVVPYVLFAQLKNFAVKIIAVLNASVGLIIGFSLFLFIVGAVRFIATAGDEKSREDGKQLMVWGVLALFVMVTVWGIVALIKTTFIG
jgi:uncharacterized membrane protein YidH (DUF202 family)